MPGQRADRDVVAPVADVRQVGDAADVDEHGRGREPQLHQRDQRHPAREELRVVAVLGDQRHGLVGRVGADVVERGGDHCTPPEPLPDRDAWIAAQTRSGVAGMSMSVTPRGASASTTAFITAGVAAIVPASPMPFTPSGFDGLGVTVWSSSMLGTSAADGTR